MREKDYVQVIAVVGKALTAFETRAANANPRENIAGVDLITRDPHAGRAVVEISLPWKRWCVWRNCLPIPLKADQIGG